MQILTTPHPFLKHKAKTLTVWDKKTAKEVKEMEAILKKTVNPKGVGLAATQVGLDKRLFILLDEASQTTKVFVNPEILEMSKKMIAAVYKKKKDRWLEGCLSIPKIWGFVDRPYSIKLKYFIPKQLDGKWVLSEQIVDYKDVESAYVQHEIDHLNGILFTDRILEQHGQMLRETEDGLSPISL
ncbi:peptide deformylase [Candidatus Collierbacteria bacterium RIFCSPLOWO2_01_FULL_50_23]|nr:MAG: peptide deformylase [Candidatus Collierbacteria bacterium RIFCSPLOWO2_01_FULL_50_23]